MNKKLKYTLIAVVVLGAIIGLHYIVDSPKVDILRDVALGGRSDGNYSTTVATTATTGVNQLLRTGPFRLERMIIGRDVTGSSIELSDTTTSTNKSPIVTFSGNALKGVYEIGLDFVSGLFATVTASDQNVFVITPK